MAAHRDDQPPAARPFFESGVDQESRPLSLTGDLFLITLDDRSGRSRVRAAPVALAGGLLAELLTAGDVSLTGGRLTLTEAAPPTDPLLRRTLGWTEPVYWLRHLASVAVGEIASRLAGDGWIHLVERGLLRPRPVYRPVDANDVFWRPSRLFHDLNARPSFDDLILYALIDAVDFTTLAFQACGGVAPNLRDWIFAQLAEHRPEHLALVNTTRALAAQHAITLRG